MSAAVSPEAPGLSHLAQRGTRPPAWLNATAEYQQGEVPHDRISRLADTKERGKST